MESEILGAISFCIVIFFFFWVCAAAADPLQVSLLAKVPSFYAFGILFLGLWLAILSSHGNEQTLRKMKKGHKAYVDKY
ncbi:MAG: hypothetical protein WC460_00540 [Patescibacteria group bacterium]